MLSLRRHRQQKQHPDHAVTFAAREFSQPVPKHEMPASSMPADVAYQIVHDELKLDGNATLNLASFVTTWMDPQADKLIAESANKNFVDQDEYPRTTEIQNRCVDMLAHLYNAPRDVQAAGTATIGSSEAIMLAGLALKWRWRDRRKAAGKPTDKPNLVMGNNVQVVWEKFARYFEVEPRYIPLAEDRWITTENEILDYVDENTIGVVGILGSTYTGEYEPIAAMNEVLEKNNQKTGWDTPIHVDAASGGFVAPFLQPKLEWDFRLPLVKSINVSGHKYGLVYPGVGWVIWRDLEDLPDDLVFHVNYLGGDEPTFNLNFSKSSSQIVAQYYNFLRLGQEGYSRIMQGLQANARFISGRLQETGKFGLLSNDESLPVVCFRLLDESRYTVFDLSQKLRESGWIVPAYTMAPNADKIAVLRVVVREGFSRDLSEMLLDDLASAVTAFEAGHAIPKADTPDEPKTKVC